MNWFPHLDSPQVQKMTTKEQGNFFVTTKGVDQKWAEAESTKTQKIIKTVGIVLVVAAFIGLIIWAILDPGPAPHIVP